MAARLNIVSIALVALLAAAPAHADTAANALAARDRALTADADTLAERDYSAGQKKLERADKLAADGRDAASVAATYREAVDLFSQAELEAIGSRLFAEARIALRDADRARAKRYAPQTLDEARALLIRAEETLAADRDERETPARIADEAARTARHATAIALLAREKPSTESLMLEWEGYVRSALAEAGVSAPADATAEELAERLRGAIAELADSEQQLRADLADSRAYNAALEAEIRDLDARLGGAREERRELVMQLESQARREEQFRQTEQLFAPDEAEVFRQSDTIVVRLMALEFASGSAKLGPTTGDLLARVNKAIETFPDSRVRVEGHTDSQGSARLNMRLSQNRADAVVDYLIENYRIAPGRLSAVGYGSERPVATNETKEGRARNRRIDLVITP